MEELAAFYGKQPRARQIRGVELTRGLQREAFTRSESPYAVVSRLFEETDKVTSTMVEEILGRTLTKGEVAGIMLRWGVKARWVVVKPGGLP